jgi:hypothetical protein
MGGPLTQDDDVRRSTCALVLCVCLLGAGGGCSSTQAAHEGTGGSGFADPTAQSGGAIAQSGGAIAQSGGAIAQSGDAIAQSPGCNQTDSTVSCCLKRHPGEPELCGAVAPNKQPPKQQPNRLPPPGTIPSASEKMRRKKVCSGYYAECIAKGGEDLERYTDGHTRCQDCYGDCEKSGVWPDAVNDHLCPEVSQ